MVWNKLNLSQKLFAGFGILMLILFIFGALAIYNLHRIRHEGDQLAARQIPFLVKTAQVERSWKNTLILLKEYALFKDDARFEAGMKELDRVSEMLREGERELSDGKSRKLAEQLARELVRFKSSAQETHRAIVQTRDAWMGMENAAIALEKAAQTYTNLQYEKLKHDIESKQNQEIIVRRVDKVSMMKEISDMVKDLQLSIRKADAENDPDLLKGYESSFVRIRHHVNSILPITTKDYDIQALKLILNTSTHCEQSMVQLIQNWSSSKRLSDNSITENGIQLVQQLSARQSELANMAARSNSTLSNSSQKIMIFGMVTLLLLGMVIVTLVTRSITGPILRLEKAARLQSEGKLVQIQTTGQTDEVAQLTDSINRSNLKIKSVVDKLRSLSMQLRVMGTKMNQSATILSENSAGQASGSEEISAAMEEMHALTSQNASLAADARRIAAHSTQTIQQEARQTREAVKVLQLMIHQSKAIHEIATQTYMLAINASIEAAKAGTHGRGFSVIAKGIRDLAERAQSTSVQLSEISTQGIEVSDRVTVNLESMEKEMKELVVMIETMATGTLEQDAEARQISATIQLFNQHIQSSSILSDELSTQAGLLQQDAVTLNEAVGFFNSEEALDAEPRVKRA